MDSQEVSTSILVKRAAEGDSVAARELFSRHREQLRRMIAIRMDRRIAARVDPSDVVQETLVEASDKLAKYLEKQPLPFYPWLRCLASERLIQLHRQHIRSQKRSVSREQRQEVMLADESVIELANRLAANDTSPSQRFSRREQLECVKAALEHLPHNDREVLVLRHLEQLSVQQAADVLGVSLAAVKTRHFRAIQRLHRLLEEHSEEFET